MVNFWDRLQRFALRLCALFFSCCTVVSAVFGVGGKIPTMAVSCLIFGGLSVWCWRRGGRYGNGVSDRETATDQDIDGFRREVVQVLAGTEEPPISDVVTKAGEIVLVDRLGVWVEMKTPLGNTSVGLSVRVAKGVSVRTGRWLKAEPIEKIVSPGSLVVTNKRVLFVGTANSFALPLDSVISIQPILGGVSIHGSRGPWTVRLTRDAAANICAAWRVAAAHS